MTMCVEGTVSRPYKGYRIDSIKVKRRIGSRRWYTVGFLILDGSGSRVHKETYLSDAKRWIDERVREQQNVVSLPPVNEGSRP